MLRERHVKKKSMFDALLYSRSFHDQRLLREWAIGRSFVPSLNVFVVGYLSCLLAVFRLPGAALSVETSRLMPSHGLRQHP